MKAREAKSKIKPITEAEYANRLAVTPGEAAYLLGVSYYTVIRMISAGQLMATRRGQKSVIIPKKALNDLLQAA